MKTNIKKTEYRKKLAELGFKVSFRKIGFSDLLREDKNFQIIKDNKGNELPSIFINDEHRKRWTPVIELKNKFNPM